MGFRAYVVGSSLVAAAIASCTQFGAEDAQPAPGAEGGTEDSTATLADASGADGNETKDCGAVLATDPRNCGRCGHDCLGGDCTAGQCQPFVIAGGLTGPGELALSESRIYWETGDQFSTSKDVVSCARGGCQGPPVSVISGLDDVKSLLVAGDTLFFATFNSNAAKSAVEACALSACPTTRRGVDSAAAGNLHPFTPMRKRAGAVYWGKTVETNGEIRRVTLDAGIEPTTIALSECVPARVTVGAMDVTWSCRYSPTIRRCAIPCTVDGGGVFLDAGNTPVNFERGATQLVWDTDENGLKLQTVAQAGGIPSDLPARGMGPIAVVGDSLIFQDGLAARIDVCELPSCASRTTLAKATAASLVADERAVFWTVPAFGVVMSVAR